MWVTFAGYTLLLSMNPTEIRLRDALNRHVTQLNNYVHLYRQSQKENINLNATCEKLQNENVELFNKIKTINSRLAHYGEENDRLKKELQSYHIPKSRKHFKDMKSKSQRRLRKKSYKLALQKLLQNFPNVNSANISLDFGCEWIQFPFSYSDINVSDILGHQNAPLNDALVTEENELPMDITENNSDGNDDSLNILKRGGKISKRHLRTIIYVMDKFKIAGNAYHELRMSCKSILPSIHLIRKERVAMSEEIPYILNAYVSTYLNVI